MAEDRFDIVFEQMDKELKSNPELQLDDLKDLMIQDEAIRRLAIIIKANTSTQPPRLYSSS